jgi:hypothetical protein
VLEPTYLCCLTVWGGAFVAEESHEDHAAELNKPAIRIAMCLGWWVAADTDNSTELDVMSEFFATLSYRAFRKRFAKLQLAARQISNLFAALCEGSDHRTKAVDCDETPKAATGSRLTVDLGWFLVQLGGD